MGEVLAFIFLVVFLIAMYFANERQDKKLFERSDHHCEHCREKHPFLGDDINIVIFTRDKEPMVMVTNSQGMHLHHNLIVKGPQ